MPNEPLVSVIINCLNGERYVEETIRSVYAQDMDDWEIIFYDNNSTDRTAEIARSFDGKLKYFKGKSTVPLGHARNLAIEKARGKYLAFADADDLCLPARLRKQVQAVEAPNRGRPIGICYSDSMRISASGEELVRYSYERQLPSGDIYLKLIKDCFIDMSTCLITAEAFNRVGGFDLKYNQVEDWDMWLKVARYYDAAFVSDILVKTRIHAASESRNFSWHHAEKRNLISGLKPRTPAESEAVEQSLRDLEVREHIASLVGIRGQKFRDLLSVTGKTAAICAKNPRITAELLAKYGNLKMIRLFFRKYIAADRVA